MGTSLMDARCVSRKPSTGGLQLATVVMAVAIIVRVVLGRESDAVTRVTVVILVIDVMLAVVARAADLAVALDLEQFSAIIQFTTWDGRCLGRSQ